MAEQQPSDTGIGEQIAHPTEVVGESGAVYQNTIVTDENLGTADMVVPDGPSIP